MLTKAQKKQQIEAGLAELKNSRTLVFADFSGVKFEDLKKLRQILRGVDARFRVFKKRLLRIAFEKSGSQFNPDRFASQLGTVFAPTDIFAVAGPVHKFGLLKILGALDLKENKFIAPEEFIKIAKLPSRAALLSKLALLISLPLKKLLAVLKGRAENIKSQNGKI